MFFFTHGHACELSSMLERLLLDGVNRQPTEMRAKLPVVWLWSHDKLRSGLHCLMVANVMSMISTVDDKVNDAIWVVRKCSRASWNSSLSGPGFVSSVSKLWTCHSCWLIRSHPQYSPYSSYIRSGKGGEGSASYQLGSSEITLSREVGSQSSSLVQRTWVALRIPRL